MSDGPLQPLDPVMRQLKAKIEESQGNTDLLEQGIGTSQEAREIGALARPNQVIKLPGRYAKFKARLWALNENEELQAQVAAHDELDKLFKGRDLSLRLAADPTILSHEISRQRLALALRRYDNPAEPLFTGAEVRNYFRKAERELLEGQLEALIAIESPLFHAASEQEVLDLLKTHAGGEVASSAFVASCDPDTRLLICTVLVDRWARQASENSSKS